MQSSPKGIIYFVEFLLFKSRYVLILACLALVLAVFIVIGALFYELYAHVAVPFIQDHDIKEVILGSLGMVDLALLANLIILVAFASYQNFVSELADKLPAHEKLERPDWLEKVDFSNMKIKLMGSVVAISAIQLLRDFMSMGLDDGPTSETVMWKTIIHGTIAATAVAMALADKFMHGVDHEIGNELDDCENESKKPASH